MAQWGVGGGGERDSVSGFLFERKGFGCAAKLHKMQNCSAHLFLL